MAENTVQDLLKSHQELLKTVKDRFESARRNGLEMDSLVKQKERHRCSERHRNSDEMQELVDPIPVAFGVIENETAKHDGNSGIRAENCEKSNRI